MEYKWKQENATNDPLSTPDLYILDPFRKGLNAAMSVTAFSEIKGCFCDTYVKLVQINERFRSFQDAQIIEQAFDGDDNIIV